MEFFPTVAYKPNTMLYTESSDVSFSIRRFEDPFPTAAGGNEPYRRPVHEMSCGLCSAAATVSRMSLCPPIPVSTKLKHNDFVAVYRTSLHNHAE